jgi:hypothetical protein
MVDAQKCWAVVVVENEPNVNHFGSTYCTALPGKDGQSAGCHICERPTQNNGGYCSHLGERGQRTEFPFLVRNLMLGRLQG